MTKLKEKRPKVDRQKAEDLISDEEMTEEEQIRAIEMQFQHIYKNDEELQRALARSDVASLSFEEKY